MNELSPNHSQSWKQRILGSRSLFSVVLSAGALFLAVVVFGFLASLKKPPAQREQVEKVYNVEVFNVGPANLQEWISGFGTVQADREVVLSAEVSGTVVNLHEDLEVGLAVRGTEYLRGTSWPVIPVPGDLLLTIDPATYARKLEQARDQLAELTSEAEQLSVEEENTKRQLEKVQRDYELYEKEYQTQLKLFQDNVITDSELRRTSLELSNYEQQLINRQNESRLFPKREKMLLSRKNTAENAVNIAELEWSKTKVRPPFSGILSEVMIERGQYVRQGDALVRLIDISRVEIPIAVTLDDYTVIQAQLQNGHKPQVRLADRETAEPLWNGVITRVAPKADNLTRTIDVFATVENSQQKLPLLPGTFVHALIEGQDFSEGIAIPRDAIVDGNIFLVNGDQVVSQAVAVQKTIQNLALIQPLEPQTGDSNSPVQIVLTNLDIIRPGVKIKLQREHKLDEMLDQQRIRILQKEELTVAKPKPTKSESVN